MMKISKTKRLDVVADQYTAFHNIQKCPNSHSEVAVESSYSCDQAEIAQAMQ
jgi:hypothetical protein